MFHPADHVEAERNLCYAPSMAHHQFQVGDCVRLSEKSELRPSGVLIIVRLLPGEREDLPPAYRVKSQAEGHERMVKEDEIELA